MTLLDSLFELMEEKNASDLHVSAGSPPYLRVDGDLVVVGSIAIDGVQLKRDIDELLSEKQKEGFKRSGALDFALDFKSRRYRCNLFSHLKGIALAARAIPTNIQSIDQLGLPPVLKKIAMVRSGLVLVTGVTGSGKSTTLAAMLDHINTHRREHVITIEDPIEFIHNDKKCLINQRELGTHTLSFSNALREALREDPDVILVGEMRDLDTISLALRAAATGHLVFSTLHTMGTVNTVNRIINVFPPEEQNHIRALLADVISAVISQVLLRRARGAGRVAAMSIMVATPAVRNLIRRGQAHQIPGTVMDNGKERGMQTLRSAIQDLIRKREVSEEEGLSYMSLEDMGGYSPDGTE